MGERTDGTEGKTWGSTSKGNGRERRKWRLDSEGGITKKEEEREAEYRVKGD